MRAFVSRLMSDTSLLLIASTVAAFLAAVIACLPFRISVTGLIRAVKKLVKGFIEYCSIFSGHELVPLLS